MADLDKNNLMEKIVSLCKRRGFIYPGSEIYGGLSGTWDYGPLGAELKKNLKDLWWREIVQLRDDMVGIDAAIMMNPKAWEASGHVEAFTDPLVECKICHRRFRADHMEELLEKVWQKSSVNVGAIGLSKKDKEMLICDKKPGQHEFERYHETMDLTEPKNFNLLVKAYLGVVEGKQSEVFLRGEITNGAHVNFKNVLNSTRVKIPFGIAQIGKAFRNEITPGNFTFRSREFEQMETQFYIKPDEEEGEKWFEYWKNNRMDFYLNLGMKKENLRFREHEDNEKAHYAKKASDIEYNSPFGWSEFMGIHHRGDWDLSRHQQYSGQDMKYKDDESGKEYIPWDIETSSGVDRSILFLLIDAYSENEDGRLILKLHPKLAPFKVGVFPLLANKPELVNKAREVYKMLKPFFMIAWDDRGNIGKRYASQDEIGTPFCLTIDFDTLKDDSLTIRDRDNSSQIRLKISEVLEYLQEKLNV